MPGNWSVRAGVQMQETGAAVAGREQNRSEKQPLKQPHNQELQQTADKCPTELRAGEDDRYFDFLKLWGTNSVLLKRGEEEEGSTKREGKSFIHQEHTLAKIAAEDKNQTSCYFHIPLTFLYLCANPDTPVVWPGRRTAWASLCTATAMAWWTKFSQLSNCILVYCAVTNSEMSQHLLFWNEDPSLPGLLSFIFKFKLNWVSLWATAAVPSPLPGLTLLLRFPLPAKSSSPPAPPLTAPAAVSSHPIGSTSSNIWAAPLLVALILQTTSGN